MSRVQISLQLHINITSSWPRTSFVSWDRTSSLAHIWKKFFLELSDKFCLELQVMGLAFSLYLEKVRIKAKVERYFKIIKEKDERVIRYLGLIIEARRDPTISNYRKESDIITYQLFIENEVSIVKQLVQEIEEIASCLSGQWEQVIAVRLKTNWPFCLGDRTLELSRRSTKSSRQGTLQAISRRLSTSPPLDGTMDWNTVSSRLKTQPS